MIGGVCRSAEGVVIELFGAGIHVEQNLLVPTIARAAGPKRMLGAIFKAAVVGPRPIRNRYGFFSRRDTADRSLVRSTFCMKLIIMMMLTQQNWPSSCRWPLRV